MSKLRKAFQQFLLFACVLGSLVGSAAAQPFDLLGGKKLRVPKPEFTATITPEAVRPGGEVTISIRMQLPADYYTYGTDGSFGGRTRIEARTTGLEPLDSEFTPDHPGKTLHDPDFGVEVTKFYEAVTWSRKYRVASNATTVTATGSLQGQYCSGPEAGGQCVPINPPFSFELTAKLDSTSVAGNVAEKANYATTVRPTRSRQGASIADPVEYEFRLSPPNAKRGDKVTLSITAWLDAGWHTYSLSQKGPGAAPTEIEFDMLRHLKPLGDAFQPDRTFTTEQSENTVLETYHDRVTWTREFEVAAEQPGDYGATGTLTYAVCDARSCLPVRAVEFALGETAKEASNADEDKSPFAVANVGNEQPPAIEIGPGQAADHNPLRAPAAAPKPHEDGMVAFLVLCIVGGFAALLTPCSFPMVPITVSFFLKQSELQHKRPWLLAAVYCGTIVLTFTVLGVGIAALFGATKLNELANNPWLNFVIALVFVGFAMNMLGAFEIHIPSQWLTWSASHETTGGYLGAVFMAITFTLTSFTCTFAVAGTLLVAAAQGEFYRPVVGMIAFGAAFASPFFALALAPNLLKKLPKSGGWMNAVKVVMGLIELGAAVKFLSVADQIWNPQPLIFDFVTVMLVWSVLALAIGLYLLGLFRFAHDTPMESISTFRALLAMCFLGLAGLNALLILQPNRAGGVLMQQIVAFAPPQLDAAATDFGPTVEHEGLKFALDLDQAIPIAAKKSRPLLLDFTGVNCINCRRMEKKMAEPQNRRLIEQFVAVQLYTDKVPTIADAQTAEQLRLRNIRRQTDWFGDVSLPSYAIVTPDGKQILAKYVGYESAEGEFTRFLDEGLQRWQNQAAAVPRPVEAAIIGQSP